MSSLADSTPTRLVAAFALAAALALPPARAANHTDEVAPLGAGPYRVACTNVAQDTAAIAASGARPQDFWEGRVANDDTRYIAQVLSAPATAVRFGAAVPDDRGLYPRFAGQSVDHVAIVCHPTSSANADPDYALPGSTEVVPRMQPAGAAPKLIGIAEFLEPHGIVFSPPPTGPAKLPLIVFSHGLGGSPISEGYLQALVGLASHGFMVAAPFHGDPRFSRIRIEDLGDVAFLLTQFDQFVEMELMRPAALKSMVDALLAHPALSPAIDADRIGGFGTSMGGQALANLLGARLTTSFSRACRETVRDPRVKAAVGLVPYAGQSFLPSFCDGQSGAGDVTAPYLAISGTADTTAPIAQAEQAVNRFASSRYLVAIPGLGHELRQQDVGDIFTWSVTFLHAYLRPDYDRGAFGRLVRMASVAGGTTEELRVDVHQPFAPAGGEVRVIEFHNENLDHYFIAAGEDEIAVIDGGGAGPGWRRTGLAFKASSLAAPIAGIPPPGVRPASAVCRFYGALAGGPNSHFFTASASECDLVKRSGGWFYEGIGFYTPEVDSGRLCATGQIAVLRAYNNGFPRNDSNHRFVTSDSTLREMARKGWTAEGNVMCALP